MLNIYQVTHRAIEEAFKAGWKDIVPIKWENRHLTHRGPSWVEISVDWGSEIQAEICTDWENDEIGGVLYVEVHVPLNEGMDEAYRLAGNALDVISHQQFNCGGVVVTTFSGRMDSGTRPEDTNYTLVCMSRFKARFTEV